MPTPSKKKKAKKGKYDYKAIAQQTEGQVKGSKDRKGGGGGNIFKPEVKFTKFNPAKDEDHSIDIVPFQAGSDMPFDMEKGRRMTKEGNWAYTFEYWTHSGFGPLENERAVCPERTWKESCPLCEHRRELIAEKAYDEKKMNLYPKRRNLYNCVCYDTDKEEEKGVQLFDVTWHWFEKYIAKLAPKAVRRKKGSNLKVASPFKNFADPSENGVCIEWTIEAAKSKNDFDDWMNHQLVQRDYALDEELLDSALQLDQIVERLSYAELYKKYYDEVYEGEEGEEEEVEEEGDEEEEEVEEGDEEEVEEEGDEDDLDTFDRSELKQILKDQEIDFKVYKSTEDDEIREAIRAARSEEEEEEEEEEEVKPRKKGKSSKSTPKKKTGKAVCPAGGTLGADFEDFDECDSCNMWNACDDKYQAEYQKEE